jgi:hypothetical protein
MNLQMGVYELLKQLFYVQINYQNGLNLGVFELLGRLPYIDDECPCTSVCYK